MKKILYLPFLFITITSLAQTNVVIQSATQEKVGAALGPPYQNDQLETFAFSNSAGGGSVTGRSFIQFDLSSIPVGSKINWAKLTLHLDIVVAGQNSSHGFNSSKLRRITSAWEPNTVTWNTQPTTTIKGQVSIPKSKPTDSVYRNITVTNLVQAMVDSPSNSFGFELKLDTEKKSSGYRNLIFVSYNTPGYKQNCFPKLVIEYTAPGLQKQAVTTLSVDLNGSSAAMNIFPNPCNGAFNCNINSTSTDNKFLKIIDVLGRTVYNQQVDASSLQLRVNLPSASPGTYFVILQDNKNATLVSQTLVVN